jgi:hypothetical protein
MRYRCPAGNESGAGATSVVAVRRVPVRGIGAASESK